MAKKTPPWPDYPAWSTARFFGFLRSALRKAYSRWPVKYQVMHEARRKCEGKGRQKFEYQCAICEEWFPQKSIQIDHIVECGSLRCWEDLTPFTQRPFCGKEGLRVLCKPCHNKVTAEQRKKAKEKEE